MSYLSPAAIEAIDRLGDLSSQVIDELAATRLSVRRIANEIARIRRREGRHDGPGFGHRGRRVWWRKPAGAGHHG